MCLWVLTELPWPPGEAGTSRLDAKCHAHSGEYNIHVQECGLQSVLQRLERTRGPGAGGATGTAKDAADRCGGGRGRAAACRRPLTQRGGAPIHRPERPARRPRPRRRPRRARRRRRFTASSTSASRMRCGGCLGRHREKKEQDPPLPRLYSPAPLSPSESSARITQGPPLPASLGCAAGWLMAAGWLPARGAGPPGQLRPASACLPALLALPAGPRAASAPV